MKKFMLAAVASLALAGMGHNMPPVTVTTAPVTSSQQAVLPRRIVDENRRNQKLQQKLRRTKRRQRLLKTTRFQRKTQKFGSTYRPGRLFKGHRI